MFVVEASDACSFAKNAISVFGFAVFRRLALLDVQQDFIALRLDDFAYEFSTEATELFGRNTEVFRFEWRRAFKYLKLVAETQNVGFTVVVTGANFDCLAAFDLQEVVEERSGDTNKFYAFADQFFVRPAGADNVCLLYTSPSPRDKRQSRMPSSA